VRKCNHRTTRSAEECCFKTNQKQTRERSNSKKKSEKIARGGNGREKNNGNDRAEVAEVAEVGGVGRFSIWYILFTC